jgi:hypothetical protein
LYIFEKTAALFFRIKLEYTWENDNTDVGKGGVETEP